MYTEVYFRPYFLYEPSGFPRPVINGAELFVIIHFNFVIIHTRNPLTFSIKWKIIKVRKSLHFEN